MLWRFHEGMGWWIVFVWIWFILLWGAIIALVVWGINKLTRRGGSDQVRSPLDIAKERYARGEISKEQYEQIKKDLS